MLGAAGMLPAIAALVVALAGPVAWREVAGGVSAAYAAVILAFLGGSWWGLASAGDPASRPPLGAALAVSVLPALAAWVALLLDHAGGLALLGLLFLVTLPGDAWIARNRAAPEWWLRLRVPLSVGMAVVTLIAGAVAAHTGDVPV